MKSAKLAGLADVETLMDEAGYALEMGELAGHPALICESPYALIACVELQNWDRLAEDVFDVQSALTRFAAEAPSARAWDLYVVALVLDEGREAHHRAIAEAIEADTRYARKLVRAAVLKDSVARALRPLLPLGPPATLAITDPLEELRSELNGLNVDECDVAAALESFRRTSEVEVR